MTIADWKPIETAPNDEAILVHYNDGRIELIAADGNHYDWAPFDGVDETNKGISSPTHWAPMPDGPK